MQAAEPKNPTAASTALRSPSNPKAIMAMKPNTPRLIINGEAVRMMEYLYNGEREALQPKVTHENM